jgi:lyso-ornithine lipid O-acyltransferase
MVLFLPQPSCLPTFGLIASGLFLCVVITLTIYQKCKPHNLIKIKKIFNESKTMLIRQFYSFTTLFLLGVLIGILLWGCGMLGAKTQRLALQRWFYRALLHVWHLRVTVEGTLAPSPALLAANHCSYVDVAVVGSLGAMRFTPKSDVKGWFILGNIAQAFDVVFVSRDRADARAAQESVMQVLRAGNRLCIFPEGTTNDGRSLKPFKSALFNLAEAWDGESPLHIQPIVVRYDGVNGLAMNDAAWETIAWYGDATLIGHLWRFSGLKDVHVTVKCLSPLTLTAGDNRKTIAEKVRTSILEHLPSI